MSSRISTWVAATGKAIRSPRMGWGALVRKVAIPSVAVAAVATVASPFAQAAVSHPELTARVACEGTIFPLPFRSALPFPGFSADVVVTNRGAAGGDPTFDLIYSGGVSRPAMAYPMTAPVAVGTSSWRLSGARGIPQAIVVHERANTWISAVSPGVSTTAVIPANVPPCFIIEGGL